MLSVDFQDSEYQQHKNQNSATYTISFIKLYGFSSIRKRHRQDICSNVKQINISTYVIISHIQTKFRVKAFYHFDDFDNSNDFLWIPQIRSMIFLCYYIQWMFNITVLLKHTIIYLESEHLG